MFSSYGFGQCRRKQFYNRLYGLWKCEDLLCRLNGSVNSVTCKQLVRTLSRKYDLYVLCSLFADKIYRNGGGICNRRVKMIYYLFVCVYKVLKRRDSLYVVNVKVLCDLRRVVHLGIILYAERDCKRLYSGAEL